MDVQKPEPMRAAHWATLIILLVAALGLRLWGISGESIWFDECITYTFLDSPTLLEFYRGEAIHDPLTVPVYYGSAYLWYNLGFASVVGMRMLSVIFGIAAIAVVYFFGRRLFGHVGGFTAALCMSMAKIQIYMSQEIRNYSLTLLLAAIAMYALHEASVSGRRKWWAINIAATILVCFTHFFALLLPFAQGVYLLITRPRQIKWITLWTAVQLPFYALIPLWIHFVQSGNVEKETAWITWTPISRVFTTYFNVFAGSLQDALDHIRRLPWGLPVHHALGALFLIAGAAFVLYCAHAVWKKREVCGGYRLAPSLLL
ncbi:MAG: glycosyltransferase family 39 protein, partial [Candidatus Hydrogenedentes bacterium]|nr:glycosyltransferase family 39 protein [Candidatus Hydrogenedentota bacterium]